MSGTAPTVPPKKGNEMQAGSINKASSANKAQLSKLVKSNACKLLNVTPALAENILKLNSRNRPKSFGAVKKYASEIQAGRWMQTGVPLIFSKEGRLIDGQHRVAAVIEAGIPVEFHCQFGIEDSAFAFIDRGKTRTAADIFAIHGVPNYAAISSAARWVWGYENKYMFSGHGGTQAGQTLNPDQLYEYYLGHQRLQESAPVFHAFADSQIASPSMMLALHYLCAQKARGQADEFFMKVATAVGFSSKQDPAYRLHRLLQDNKASERRMRSVHVAAITVNAWNAMRKGQVRFSKDFESGASFPRIK